MYRVGEVNLSVAMKRTADQDNRTLWSLVGTVTIEYYRVERGTLALRCDGPYSGITVDYSERYTKPAVI